MITIFIDPPPASARWADLTEELDRWGAQGRKATLWWRDDDAVAPSHQLAGLVNLARGVPVALAVIPALIRPSLADWLENNAASSWRILQHGWRHVAHATDKKSEFPATRDAGSVAAGIACSGSLAIGHCRCWLRPGTGLPRNFWRRWPRLAWPVSPPSSRGARPIPIRVWLRPMSMSI